VAREVKRIFGLQLKFCLQCFSDSMEEANGSGYFLVDPVIHAGKMDDRVPMDCLQCQTVLAKALGPFNEWQDRLRVAHEAGYNMIHFTPIQELGESNSSYCIRDQLMLNSAFSTVWCSFLGTTVHSKFFKIPRASLPNSMACCGKFYTYSN